MASLPEAKVDHGPFFQPGEATTGPTEKMGIGHFFPQGTLGTPEDTQRLGP